jgi:tRNA(Ile)-lysidine synthase
VLHQLFNMPRSEKFYVAVSGGVDSMAVASFYREGDKQFSVCYFNHGTAQADVMEAHVSAWAKDNHVAIELGHIKHFRPKEKKESPEEYWRAARYDFFGKLPCQCRLASDPCGPKVVLGQHLDDAAETYLFSAINGTPKLIKSRVKYPYNLTVLRPFLTTRKEELREWAVKHNVSWVEDASNADVHYPRNKIRHDLMPHVLQVNPGFLTVIRKKILAELPK